MDLLFHRNEQPPLWKMTDPILDQPTINFDLVMEDGSKGIAEKKRPLEPIVEPPNVTPADYTPPAATTLTQTKADLIQAIQETRQLADLPMIGDTALARMTKSQLRKLLAESLTAGASRVGENAAANALNDEISSSNSATGAPPLPPVNPADVSQCALMMFRMNCALAAAVSRANNESNPYIELDGYVTALERERELLLHAYSAVYLKHREELQTIMDPGVQILLLNLTAIASSARFRG